MFLPQLPGKLGRQSYIAMLVVQTVLRSKMNAVVVDRGFEHQVVDCNIWRALQRGQVGHGEARRSSPQPVCSLILGKISKFGATRFQTKAKMHQIRFPLGLRFQIQLTVLSRPPNCI